MIAKCKQIYRTMNLNSEIAICWWGMQNWHRNILYGAWNMVTCLSAKPKLRLMLNETRFVQQLCHIKGLVQDCSISIAYALEMLQFCTKP